MPGYGELQGFCEIAAEWVDVGHRGDERDDGQTGGADDYDEFTWVSSDERSEHFHPIDARLDEQSISTRNAGPLGTAQPLISHQMSVGVADPGYNNVQMIDSEDVRPLSTPDT
jgi:hypothetical protein